MLLVFVYLVQGPFQVQSPARESWAGLSLAKALLCSMLNFQFCDFLCSMAQPCVHRLHASCSSPCSQIHLGWSCRARTYVSLFSSVILCSCLCYRKPCRGMLAGMQGVVTCTQTQVYSAGSAPTARGNLPVPWVKKSDHPCGPHLFSSFVMDNKAA